MKQSNEPSCELSREPFEQTGDLEQSLLNTEMANIRLGRSKVLNLARIRLTELQQNTLLKFLLEDYVCDLEKINLNYCCINLNSSDVFERFLDILKANNKLITLELLGYDLAIKIKNTLLDFARSRNFTIILDLEKHPLRRAADEIPFEFDRNSGAALSYVKRYNSNGWSSDIPIDGMCKTLGLRSSDDTCLFCTDLSFANFNGRHYETYLPGDEGSPGGYIDCYLRFCFNKAVKFHKVMLYSTRLMKSLFFGASMLECCFNYSDFTGATIFQSEFIHCDMIGIKLNQWSAKTKISNSRFRMCDMRSANFLNVELAGCDLREVNLAGSALCGTVFSDCDLRHTNLTKIQIYDGVRFINCNMSGVDLSDCVEVNRLNFTGSILFGAKLPKTIHLEYDKLKYSRASQLYLQIIEKAKGSAEGIQILELAELKLLYHHAFKNKNAKTYMLAIGPIVKEVNRQKVYGLHILKKIRQYNANFPFPLITHISRMAQAPDKPFLTQSKFRIRYKGDIFSQLQEASLSLMIIKPAGMIYLTEIIKDLLENNFIIVAMKSVLLSEKQIQTLYLSLHKTYFFNSLQNYLLSSRVQVLAVCGDAQGLRQWKLCLRERLGKSVVDNFLRLAVEKGVDFTASQVPDVQREIQNGLDILHCSDYGMGKKELRLFFTESELALSKPDLKWYFTVVRNLLKSKRPENSGILALPAPNSNQANLITEWLMLVKPTGINYLQKIIAAIQAENIHIVAAKFVKLTKAQLKNLYAKYHKSYFYDTLIKYLTQHSCLALVLQGQYVRGIECRLHLRETLKNARTAEAQALLQRYDEKRRILQDEALAAQWITEYILMFDVIHSSDYADRISEIEQIFDRGELVAQHNSLDVIAYIQSLLNSYRLHRNDSPMVANK